MRLHFTPITHALGFVGALSAITLSFNTAWLVAEPTRAVATEIFGLTSGDANRLVGDLTPPTSPNQWQQKMEGEIQRLLERNKTSSESSLETEPSFQNNVNIQEELKRIPQLQLDTPNHPSVDR